MFWSSSAILLFWTNCFIESFIKSANQKQIIQAILSTLKVRQDGSVPYMCFQKTVFKYNLIIRNEPEVVVPYHSLEQNYFVDTAIKSANKKQIL